jgi:transcriptional regulator GlxA family with amidase domain
MKHRRKKKIGFLVYDGLQGLDLFGPQEVFATASQYCPESASRYETIIVSEDGAAITTESGVVIGAHTSMRDCPALHTLIIPGGAGSREEHISQAVVDWVKSRARTLDRVASVCTGIFILARTGLLDGRPVTTHWHHIEEASACFPKLQIRPDALYVRAGPVITAAGISAGIDMALALVEEDLGATIAASVAKELVVFLRRPGGQNQFSTFLRQQAAANDKFSELLAWIADNLGHDLSTEALAARACLSERHFRRAFKDAIGETPARAVERIRIEAAKDWLATTGLSIARISQNVGFQSPDAFRRAFDRVMRVSPTDYRQRFGAEAADESATERAG